MQTGLYDRKYGILKNKAPGLLAFENYYVKINWTGSLLVSGKERFSLASKNKEKSMIVITTSYRVNSRSY